MRWMFGIALAALFVPPAMAGDTVDLAPAVWADYQIYLRHLGDGPAFYAVTKDGLGGAPSGCALTKCLPTGDGKTETGEAQALERCQDVSPPSRSCIIFAKDGEIVVDYEMRAY
jgi:hypothetical protein